MSDENKPSNDEANPAEQEQGEELTEEQMEQVAGGIGTWPTPESPSTGQIKVRTIDPKRVVKPESWER